MITVRPHVQVTRRQSLRRKPVKGVGPASFGTAREIDDLTVQGRLPHQRQTFGQGRVVDGLREEGPPVLKRALEEVHPVTDVSKDSIDVEDGQRSHL